MICPSCSHDNIPGVDVCAACGTGLAGLDLAEARGGVGGQLLSDRIGAIELSPALSVAPSSTVGEAIAAMRQQRSGCVLVIEGERLVGLLNERHVLTRVVRTGLDPSTPVSDVMSREVVELSPEDPPAHAVHCMVSRGMRHLPVVQGGRAVGVVSVRNILAYLVREVLPR